MEEQDKSNTRESQDNPELELWMKPWAVIKISAFHDATAVYNQCWGVITEVQPLDQPTPLFTIENIRESIFFTGIDREPYKSTFEHVDPEARERIAKMLAITPEEALKEAAKLEPAMAKLKVAVYDEGGEYKEIELYDVEVKWPIGSLEEKLWDISDQQYEEEVVPFIKDVMTRKTAIDSGE